ncbi:MAG TPA: ATP-binding cassette domain-containing protein [Syntrophomonadaceae bacterium]|nr:ATP-binding cassette domain-containing protein [Syntrophomonadaceae bacterium]
MQVSAELSAGAVLAVKGPSGVGKSTLMRMLARLIVSEQGQVFLQGHPWMEISPGEWRRRVHYVAQKPVLLPGSLEYNFHLPFTLAGLRNSVSFSQERLDFYMIELGLGRSMLEQPAQTLSGGEAARAALIRALLIHPQVLLLDEPTAYLDDDSHRRVMAVLKYWLVEKEERGIILVSHQNEDLSEVGPVSILSILSRQEEVKHES